MPQQVNESHHDFISIYCQSCGHKHQVRVDCGFRFCPECSIPRGARIRRRLKYIMDNYPPPPGDRLRMITLSTRNCQNLALGIKHLVASFRKLRQQKFWKKYCSGGATIIEITGKKGDYHPHLHILCYCNYVPWKDMAARWKLISGGTGCHYLDVPKDKALDYVTKYVTKSEVPEGDLRSISDEIKKYRLFQRFGLWHGFLIPKLNVDFACPDCKGLYWITDWELDHMFRRDFSLSPPRTAVAPLHLAEKASGAITLPLFPAPA